MGLCIEARERDLLWIGSSSTDGFMPRLQARQLEAVFQKAPHLKAQPEKKVDGVTESWKFPLNRYDELWELLRTSHIECAPRSSISDAFFNAFPVPSPASAMPKYLASVKLKDGQKILPFQIEGIKFGISRDGRCLIGDEPGCGKTLQAIGIAYEFQQDWPILVIVPSSLRSVWKLQLEFWGENIFKRNEIQIIYEGKVPISPLAKIVVTSYELANLNSDKFMNHRFKFLICDEAHKIKNSQAQRTQTVTDLARQASRILLMTGTPIVNIATDVYQLLKVLAGNNLSFPSQACFEERYFLKREKAFRGKLQCSDPCREHELHAVLTSTIMIRRLKREVLSQMPDKFRSPIELDLALVQELKEFREITVSGEYDALKQRDLQRLFHTTCCLKKEASATYVAEVIDCTIHDKYLVFAHHVEMLDTLEKVLAKAVSNQGGSMIRICGKTHMRQRGDLVDKFQTDPKCRVAILSITACAEGITLTAASNIIFAELHWTPAIMTQCEGRAHRMGQKNNVHIQYLLTPGKNSVDYKAYSALTEKQLHCDRVVDGLQKTRDEDAFPMYMKDRPKVLDNLEMNKKLKVFPKRMRGPSPTAPASASMQAGKEPVSGKSGIPKTVIARPPSNDAQATQIPAVKPNPLAGRRIIEKPVSVPKANGGILGQRAETVIGRSIPESFTLSKACKVESVPTASFAFRNSSSSSSVPEPRAKRAMTSGERYLHEMRQAILRKIDISSETARMSGKEQPQISRAAKEQTDPIKPKPMAKQPAQIPSERSPVPKEANEQTSPVPKEQPKCSATKSPISETSAREPIDLESAREPIDLVSREPVDLVSAREPVDLVSDDETMPLKFEPPGRIGQAPAQSSDIIVQGCGGPVYSMGKRLCSPEHVSAKTRRITLADTELAKELPEAGSIKGKQVNRTLLRDVPGANAKNARGMYGLFVEQLTEAD